MSITKVPSLSEARTPIERPSQLPASYASALKHFLSEAGEPTLARARELGRKAFADGLTVGDMARVHSRAVAGAMSSSLPRAQGSQMHEAAASFFAEALRPFEGAPRGLVRTHRMLQGVNDLLERQATRIAFALHNEAAQLLASVHFALADLASRLPGEPARQIHGIRGLLDNIEDQLRHLAHELRPPILNELGLAAALQFLADGITKRRGVSVTVEASVERTLPATVETTLYRIAQEALTNVVQHAKARQARVVVQQSAHAITCTVCDDGTGFDGDAVAVENHWGLGLVAIEDRVAALGGILHVRANQPHGTELSVEIPLIVGAPA